jgi:hypothetical protein
MKSILTILFSFLFIVSGFSQTRNVVVDTNGVVVQPTNIWTANATNARSGLGLGATWLTNTNVTNFRSAIGLGSTNDVTFGSLTLDSVDQVVLNGNKLEFSFGLLIEAEEQKFLEQGNDIFQWATNLITFYVPINFSSSAVVSETKTNLGLSATWLTNTNVTNFRTAIGLGSTNAVTFGNVAATSIKYEGGGSTAIDLADGILRNQSQSVLEFGDSNVINVSLPIAFVTNSLAATTRTNLGIGATWLTNTNVTNFRTAIGLGATNEVSFDDIQINEFGEEPVFVKNESGSIQLAVGTNETTTFSVSDTVATLAVYLDFNNSTNAAITRTNLGLGWPALTNSNAGTGLVSVNTNGTVVSPTNFWQVAPIQTLVQSSAPVTNSTNAATNSRNLYVYSLATNIISVTNTITLPTNTSAFDGDEVTVIHRGGSNSVTTVRELGSTNNLISLNSYDEAVKFIKDGNWDFYHNISFTEAIRFSGTNASDNAATSRTNLGIPLTALTNTNSSGFQRAIFSTNSAPTNSANINTINFNTAVAWMEVSVITNGVTNSYRIPLFQ